MRTALIAVGMLAASIWVGQPGLLGGSCGCLPTGTRPTGAGGAVPSSRSAVWPGRHDRLTRGDRGRTRARMAAVDRFRRGGDRVRFVRCTGRRDRRRHGPGSPHDGCSPTTRGQARRSKLRDLGTAGRRCRDGATGLDRGRHAGDGRGGRPPARPLSRRQRWGSRCRAATSASAVAGPKAALYRPRRPPVHESARRMVSSAGSDAPS